MKKAIAVILSLLLVLASLSAVAETATLPAVVPAESVDAFVGEWEMVGVVVSGIFFDNASYAKMAGLSATPEMELTIRTNNLTLKSGGSNATADISMKADGTLSVGDSSGSGYIDLREDGTIFFWFDSNEGSSYVVVFGKK